MSSDARPRARRVSSRDLPDGSTRLLGIVGDPLEHSLSPRLHTAVLRSLDRNLIYVPFPVSRDRLPTFLEIAPQMGILGFNVTTPFKEEVRALVHPMDQETEKTEMVNTILFRDGKAFGCGTDGAGILSWLEEVGLKDVPFGILGFGATGRSLAYRALATGAPPLTILTRRPSEARERFASWGGEPGSVAAWPGPAGNDPSTRGDSSGGAPRPSGHAEGVCPTPGVWVSTLPPDAAPLPASFWTDWVQPGRKTVFLDMNYGLERARSTREARDRGIFAADGAGPLCHQAALSLSLWLGQEVPPGLFVRALGRGAGALRPSL